MLDSWDILDSVFLETGAQVRVITYTNPFLASTNGTHGAPPTVYLDALAKDFLVRDEKGEVIILEDGQSSAFKYAMVDLLNPAALEWYQTHVRCQVHALS